MRIIKHVGLEKHTLTPYLEKTMSWHRKCYSDLTVICLKTILIGCDSVAKRNFALGYHIKLKHMWYCSTKDYIILRVCV